MQSNLLANFPKKSRGRVAFKRISNLKQTFEDVISDVMYTRPVNWHLAWEGVCEEGALGDEYSDLYTQPTWYRDGKQFSKASGLNLQENCSWAFPDTESHSTCVCLFPLPPLHFPSILLEDIQTQSLQKQVFLCLSHRAAGYEKKRHQKSCLVIKC